MADNTNNNNQAPPKRSKKKPQEVLSAFWDKFHAKHPGKVTSIFPRSLYSNVLPPVDRRGARSARNAAESYEVAAHECREAIARIRRECIRTNEKFTDPDFDIEGDGFHHNCLRGLVRPEDDATGDDDDMTIPMSVPNAVKRLDWIFEAPQFTIKGFSSSDIQQGRDGDCWWLAAVATIAHRKDLMNKVCVERDEECGAYGFVFYRDGEWIPVVVDDNLYLIYGDYLSDNYNDASGKKAKQWRERQQTGSEALYFSHCEDPNETWLPLLEKAYAKAHGDYQAIDGGFAGQGVEDLTGGVTTTLVSNRVFNKDKLWSELPKSDDGDGEFVFALSANWSPDQTHKSGVALCHAYSILEARKEVDDEGKVYQLVKIRNPWGVRGWDGMGEWSGPWSDGSKEWTPYWLKKLGHTFGDDGVFWMSYKDMLETFSLIHRTRLFDREWMVVQQWTSAQVSWITGYLLVKFGITVRKAGTVVIVLSQLDDRYFQGFEGEYWFELHFVLQAAGAGPGAGEHICRVRPGFKWDGRSVSCEVDLAPGDYEVLPKITATRSGARPVEDVVRRYAERNPQKLRQVGMSYDLAHAKGGVPDEDALLEERKAAAKQKKNRKKEKALKKKALAKAARHVKQAQEALAEVVKGDDTKAVPGGGDAAAAAAAAAEKPAGEAPPAGDGPQPAPAPAPVAGEAAAAQQPPAPHPEKDAPPAETKPELEKSDKAAEGDEAAAAAAAKTEKEGKKEKEEKEEKNADEAKDDESEDEEESSDSSDSSDSDSDSDSGETGPELSPWNAVAVVGLRVYARDQDVAVSLIKPTETDEVTNLTVEGKPAGATL